MQISVRWTTGKEPNVVHGSKNVSADVSKNLLSSNVTPYTLHTVIT